ncbi:branched-chain amino acid ABC transporter permease [Candidatus Woesearchaeota archaeon]|nr:branched-chain amino acid ABC transporter permease [Candidatus Woesearchaeota archaeon]MBW3016650.1 branched-chain amino acid ABC transporter permease [Candidatus Woesearchaeota archaeon]
MAFINYLIHLAILVCIYSILTISLNWAVGFTGLLNLGHVGFFGIGAYASALLVMNGFPVWLGLLFGALFALVFGCLLALPTARLKGDYLALATLGFAFIMGSVARNWTSLTRGALGIPGIPKIVKGNFEFLVIVFIIAVVVYLIFWRLSRSRFGKVCESVRDDELAAKTLGKDTFVHKIFALGISAFFAGLAGGLFAHYITFIDPSIFGLGDLILLFSMLIVGGLASVKGSAIGTLIIFLLPEPLRFIGFPSSVLGPMREIIFALILLLILIYKPRGVFGKVDLS